MARIDASVVHEFVSPDRKHRVLILKRYDGSYSYEQEHWSDEPREQCWLPVGGHVSYCATEEIAMREAAANAALWLRVAEEA